MRTSENRLTRERNLIVISAWAGIVGAILLNVVPTVTGLFTPGYSTSSQTINDLGIGPTAWIVNTIQFVVGVLFATFAVGFRKAIGPVINRKLTTTTALLFLSGVGRLLIAVFTVDGPWTPGKLGTPTSLHGILNIDAILFTFFSATVSIFIIGRYLLKASAWRGYGWYSIATGLAAWGLFILSITLSGQLGQFIGLFERGRILVPTSWVGVTGLRLLRSRSSLTAPVAGRA